LFLKESRSKGVAERVYLIEFKYNLASEIPETKYQTHRAVLGLNTDNKYDYFWKALCRDMSLSTGPESLTNSHTHTPCTHFPLVFLFTKIVPG